MNRRHENLLTINRPIDCRLSEDELKAEYLKNDREKQEQIEVNDYDYVSE